MDLLFWQRIHGGSTHFPIVLLLASGMSVAAALMVGADYSGGEISLGPNNQNVLSALDRPTSIPDQPALFAAGQQLFLKNCAHCHGADARGNEGPDLHNLDWTEEQLVTRIRNGKKGQMTAFAGKLSPQQIREVVAYLRALK